MRARYLIGDELYRFEGKVLKTDKCWYWTAALKDGYGAFRTAKQKTVRAHKWYFERLNGSVRRGYELDHMCNHRNCVNPNHLDVVTHHENVKRAPIGKRALRKIIRTHCPSGHPYIPSNTYILPSTKERRCRICTKRSRQKWLLNR